MNELAIVRDLYGCYTLRFTPSERGGGASVAQSQPKTETAALQESHGRLYGRASRSQNACTVTLVDHNPLVMSVETLAGRTGPFIITVDREFIGSLNHEEVEAALSSRAWPRVDLHARAVRADRAPGQRRRRCASSADRAFEPVYERCGRRTGIRGNLIEFIGPPSQ